MLYINVNSIGIWGYRTLSIISSGTMGGQAVKNRPVQNIPVQAGTHVLTQIRTALCNLQIAEGCGAAKQIRTADLILTKDIQTVAACRLLTFDNVREPLRHKGFKHLSVVTCRLLAYIVGMGFLVPVWVNVWVNLRPRTPHMGVF